jgi:hypothetical protein
MKNDATQVKSKKAQGKIKVAVVSIRSHITPSIFSFRVLPFYFLLFTFPFCLSVSAQTRDYFTDEEIEMIRDAQQIDHRIDLLIRIMDRRFAVLKIDVGGSKAEGKEWGALPTGTRTELLADIKNILQKAVDDIDNLSERPNSMVLSPEEKDKKPKGFSDLFPKAVRSLAKAAERYKGPLTAALGATKDEKEKGILLNSIDMCNEIIESVSKLK